jgi:GntR family transcriptional regulator / MocR family aminotransferase
MPSDWSNDGRGAGRAAGRDLFVAPDVTGGRQAGLERALREAIRSGRLSAATRLPSSRALAADLGWARGTVAGAYGQLVAEGWLSARAGAGTVVAADQRRAAGSPPPAEAPAPRAPRYDLRAGNPDVGSFPRAAWAAALRRVLRDAPDEALRLGDPRGRLELRRALAAYLGRARGVAAAPERIVVCSGFTQALGLLAAVTSGAVAMEDPCLAVHREVVRAAGLPIVPLPVDEGGARVEHADGAAAAVVTPAHQVALGHTLAPERRARLVEWARATGGVVLEDDYDGEFRYDRQPVGALQALAPEHVAYAGTASKALAPALRLAWLVLPERLVEPVVEAKRLADHASPALEQLALADFVESGELDRHLRRARARYRRRRDALLTALAERAPAVEVLGIAAGLHVTLALPPGAPPEAEIRAAAAQRALALTGLARFWHDPAGRPPHLLLGYATPPDHAFAGAVERLASLLGDLMPAASRGS